MPDAPSTSPRSSRYLHARGARLPQRRRRPATRRADRRRRSWCTPRGFAPVPHIAVRNFAIVAALDGFLARMTGEAGVRRAARHRRRPRSACRIVPQRSGSDRPRRAATPWHRRDRHRRLSRRPCPHLAAGARSRPDRQDRDRGADRVAVHIVTQFCFDAQPIVAWIGRLRDFGIEQPVHRARGPDQHGNASALCTALRRTASAQGLARQAGLARHMFGMSAPDALVRALADAHAAGSWATSRRTSSRSAGIATTARWASTVAAGRITLDAGGGFAIQPPR